MNHLLRGHAPLSDSNWKLLDDEARERLHGPLAARRLVDFIGPQGWEHSATNLGRTEAVDGARARASTPCAAGCCRWSSCGPTSPSPAPSCATTTAAPSTSTSSRSTRPRSGSRSARTSPSSTAGRRPGSPASPRPRRSSPSRSARAPTDYPRSVARAVEALREAGVEGPYGLALGPDEYIRVIETAEHGGYPLFDHLAKILAAARSSGRRGSRGRSWSACAAATSSSSRARTSRSATTTTTPRRSHLYLEESFSFVVATPEAAAPLSRLSGAGLGTGGSGMERAARGRGRAASSLGFRVGRA